MGGDKKKRKTREEVERRGGDWLHVKCNKRKGVKYNDPDNNNNNNNNSNEEEEAATTTTMSKRKGGGRTVILRGRLRSDFVKLDRQSIIDDIMPWYLYTFPSDCLHILYNHLNQNNLLLNHKNNTDLLFNHSLRHTFPIPFELSSNHVSSEFSDLYHSSWVILGSAVYFFGFKESMIYYLESGVVGTASPVSFKLAGRMFCQRNAPKLVSLDDQVYVFSKAKGGWWGEVFKPHSNRFEGVSRPISNTPIPPSDACEVLFADAITKERKIVVGFKFKLMDGSLVKKLFPDIKLTEGTAVFIYDVVRDAWVKHTTNLFVNHESRLLCEPILVDHCLYWLDNEMMWAYDLNTNQYFEGPIEDAFFRHVVDTDNISYLSLLHSVGDIFYLIWADLRDPAIHCTMIYALKITTNLHDNRFRLRAIVSCCQTFNSGLSSPPFLKDGALIL